MVERILLNGTGSGDNIDVSGEGQPYEIHALGGNDTVVGTAFDDVIEGGRGHDTLFGGDGNDTFLVLGTNQGEDRIDGGAGYDVILGGDGDDTFRLRGFTLSQSIEEIDGGGGSNIISGSGSKDVLDFSATALINIDLIDGGGGNDLITGTAFDDMIKGGKKYDTLIGGGGTDTAVYDGNIGDYDITVNGNQATVKDLVGNEATDSLTDFTFLLFNDAVFDLTGGGGGGGTPPEALDDTASTDEELAVVVGVLDNDSSPNAGVLSITAVSQGANGSVVINPDDTVTYTPETNFFGTDSFTYTVSDGPLSTATASVEVTVAPQPDPPVAQDDQVSTGLDIPLTIDVLANDHDPDGDGLTLSGFTQPTNGSVTQNTDGTLLYTPDSGFSGSDSLTYTITDGSHTTSANVDIQVSATVDPIVLFGTGSGDNIDVSGEGQPYEIHALGGNDTVVGTAFDDVIEGGRGHDTLFGGDGNDTFLVLGTNQGEDRIDGGAGYDVILGGDGDDTFRLRGFTLSQSIEEIDGGGGSNIISGSGSKDVLDFSATALINIDLIDGGGGNDLITGTAFDDMIKGGKKYDTLIGGGGTDTAVYDGNIGDYDITVNGNQATVKDLVGNEATDSLTDFTFLLFNDAVFDLTGGGGGGGTPPEALDDTASTDEELAVVVGVLDNDSSPNAGVLSITAVSQGANGSVVINPDDTVTYTPETNFFGTDSFTYTVSDGPLSTATASVEVTVAPQPDPPVAQDDQVSTGLDIPLTIDVLANDHDPDGDGLTLSGFTQPTNGSVTQNTDGTLLYTPDSGFSGSDSLTYTITDGSHTTSANVDIQVTTGPPPLDTLSFRQVLTSTPEHEWVRFNLNQFIDVWTPFAQRADGGNAKPDAVLGAWSSMAWDSARGDLIFWGGGHANYPGNEIYLWHSSTFEWERASLPSEVVTMSSGQKETIDGYLNAPISSHTYDNNEYLPIVDRFITWGGAAYGTGGPFIQSDGQTLTGPYFWDPSKADGEMVGGTTGSHANPELFPDVIGGEMWENRDNLEASGFDGNLVMGTTAYAEEDGKDVIYFGRKTLWKYTVNDINDPSADTYEQVGRYYDGFSGDGAGAIDPDLNIYVRTAKLQFTMWDLDTAGPDNKNISFVPVDPTGTFDFNDLRDFGMDYDPIREIFVLWNGDEQVWSLTPVDGVAPSEWILAPLAGGIFAEVPNTSSQTSGVFGKWKYIAAQDVFIGVNDDENGDIWVYKPDNWQPPNDFPELTIADIASMGLQPNDVVPVADFVNWSDADGDLVSFRFTDLNADASSGHFLLDGDIQLAGQEILIDSDQLVFGNLSWVVADAGYFDDITIQLSDPFGSAPIATVRLPDDSSNTAPDVVASDTEALPSEILDMADLISASDDEGDLITTFRFWDEVDSGVGHFSLSGVSQPEGQWIQTDDLAETQYVANPDIGMTTVWVQATDGQEWSDWESFVITTTVGV